MLGGKLESPEQCKMWVVVIAKNDPELAIVWPDAEPVLSERDRRNPPLAAVRETLPRWEG